MFRFSAPQPAGFFTLGEGNGNPLQYSCLEYPMDRGAWWATVHGIARVGHDLETKPPPKLQNREIEVSD